MFADRAPWMQPAPVPAPAALAPAAPKPAAPTSAAPSRASVSVAPAHVTQLPSDALLCDCPLGDAGVELTWPAVEEWVAVPGGGFVRGGEGIPVPLLDAQLTKKVQPPAKLPEPVLKWSKSRRAWVLPEAGCLSGLPPRVCPALRALGPRAPRAAPQHVGQHPGRRGPLLAVVKKIQESHTLQ